jgi:hypothetical protein
MRIRVLARAAAVMFASACATDAGSNDLVRVHNGTRMTLAVFAFPNGTLVDPVIHLPPRSFEENMIRPGGQHGFNDIPGYQPEHGVYLLVYLVLGQGADLNFAMTVTAEQLQLSRGQVHINAIAEPR